MPIITLTSDWGNKDHYKGAVKGSILKKLPEATIVDISHQIPANNILQCSFILKNCYKTFPEGTVHIVGVKTEASIESPHTIVMIDNQYFIGADNGVFSLIFDKKPEKIVEISIIQESDYFTFSSRDVFVSCAVHLAQGKPMEEIGSLKENLYHRMNFNPVVTEKQIKGGVIYIDNYENVITNISQEMYRKIGKGRPFKIYLSTLKEEIHEIKTSYSDVLEGEKLALFSSTGLLEIAINQGDAASLLGLRMYDPISIEFFD